jgi:hypothetical protein
MLSESTTWKPFEAFSSFPWTPKSGKKFKSIIRGIPLTSSSYHHWLIEDLASSIFSMEVDKLAPLLVGRDSPPYVWDFIKLAGRKYEILSTAVNVKNLVFVAKAKNSGWPCKEDLEVVLNYRPFKSAKSNRIKGKKSMCPAQSQSVHPK